MRNDPISAIPKIMTGKRAKERLPNIVEWTRHSSFTMLVNSSNMAILPDEREEEGGQVFAPCGQVGNGAGMEQGPLVEDRKPRTDLLGDLEDMGREKDRPARFDISRKVILDKVLHDRVEVDQGLIDERERRFVD